MQYPEDTTNAADCHSKSIRKAIDAAMRDPNSQRLFRHAAARATGLSGTSPTCEDLIADVMYAALAGELLLDDQPVVPQLLGEVTRRGRRQMRKLRGVRTISIDDADASELVDPDTEPGKITPRDAPRIMDRVRRLAQDEIIAAERAQAEAEALAEREREKRLAAGLPTPLSRLVPIAATVEPLRLALRLADQQMTRGRAKRRDALAAGFSPYQYRIASARLTALCHAAIASLDSAGPDEADLEPLAEVANGVGFVENLRDRKCA